MSGSDGLIGHKDIVWGSFTEVWARLLGMGKLRHSTTLTIPTAISCSILGVQAAIQKGHARLGRAFGSTTPFQVSLNFVDDKSVDD